MVCIGGICPFFSVELGGQSSQVHHLMTASSQAGSRGEVKEGVGSRSCGRFRIVRSGLWDALLPCLMLRRKSTSVVSNGLQNAACYTCCWLCACIACSRQWCAPALHACACASAACGHA